jgi:hypothetical protein
MESCSLPLPYEYSKYLFYSSFLIGASSFVCLYYRDYNTFTLMFMLFLTSTYYWISPDYGIRRNIDMFLCKMIGAYFYGLTILFRSEFYSTMYIYALYNITFLYLLEYIYVYYNSAQWIIIHMGIHFYISFFTPFVLYIL